MRTIRLFLFIFALVLTSPTWAQQTPSSKETKNSKEYYNYFFHTVERGETLYSIATMYGVTVSAIQKLNGITENSVKTGTRIKIPQTVSVPDAPRKKSYQYHTIAAGETLFAVARKYGLTVNDLIEMNPGLTSETFQIGKVLRLDVSLIKKSQTQTNAEPEDKFFEYTLHKNESIFSICRKFNVSTDSLTMLNPDIAKRIQEGGIIKIPIAKQALAKKEKPDEETDEPISTGKPDEPASATEEVVNQKVKVALLLPFLLDAPAEEGAKQSRRFVEYYEGLLLSVEKLKMSGISIDLHVFDTGSESKSIARILKTPEMDDMQLIIGPVYNAHIAEAARFAKENHITLVIPFTSKNEEVLNNAQILQINTPQNYLYSEAIQMFYKKFRKDRIVFIEEKNKPSDKAEFISLLKTELKRKSVPFQVFAVENYDELDQLSTSLSTDKENIIIPTSGKTEDLRQYLPALQSLVINKPEFRVSLFGYPEWQTFTKDYMEAFYNLNTYIYTSFYANTTSAEFKEINSGYKNWFQREMINSYPKYGLLGYDTGYYLLKAAATSQNGLEKNIIQKSFNGIQSGFYFERVNNWGGLINKNVYLIHYGRNFEISKIVSGK